MANISQVQVGSTTYDICDATTRDSLDAFRNNYIYSQYKFEYGDTTPITVTAYETTIVPGLGRSMGADEEAELPVGYTFKAGIFSASVFSVGNARDQALNFWDTSANVFWAEDVRRLERTTTVAHTLTAILNPTSPASWLVTTKIWSTVELSGVHGYISYILFFS